MDNPLDARFCKACGFFIGEGSGSEPPESSSSYISPPKITPSQKDREKDSTDKSIACPRCGNDVEGLERCPLCGLTAPLGDETPDDFLGDIMVGMPLLLVNPEKFADILPYRKGMGTLVQPVLWTTLAFFFFWVTIYISRGMQPVILLGTRISIGTFLLISLTVLVFIIPAIIVLYILLLHGTSLLAGGRGIIERSARTLCVVIVGVLLITATLMSLYLVFSKMTEMKYGIPDPDNSLTEQILLIPLLLKFTMYAAWFYFLTLQIRVLARVHYMDPSRSVAAHVLAAIPVGLYFLLSHCGYI